MPGDSYHVPSGIMGFVGRVTYNYDDRYMFEVNAGYNGTEQFAEGKRFGLFPAVSGGWVPTKEKWFPKNEVLSFMKIRGSYGEVGNDRLGAASGILHDLIGKSAVTKPFFYQLITNVIENVVAVGYSSA